MVTPQVRSLKGLGSFTKSDKLVLNLLTTLRYF